MDCREHCFRARFDCVRTVSLRLAKIEVRQTQMPDVTCTFQYLAVKDGAVREQLFAIRTNRGEKNVGVRFTTRYGGAKILFAVTNPDCTMFGFASNGKNL
jgi:hypothetical protein